MNLTVGTYLNRGRYRIEKILGQGSFGITYLATINIVGTLGSIATSTKVAIKEFFMREINGRDEETVTTGSKEGIFYTYKRRFIKEAKTLSKLNHPNIVHVLDLFEENNTAYYVMEFLEGGNLDKLISDKNGLSIIEAYPLIKQVALALGYMHSNKMLHLDLKPANIMLNKKGEAVLIDFGLTKEFDKNGIPESSTTIGRGTPGYAPIEQSNYQSGQGFPITMDIYALGATLYKMLTGKRPPNASDILNEGVDILNLISIQSREIAEAITKAMNPFKNKRFQNVEDFISALKIPTNNTNKEALSFPTNTVSFLIIMKNQAVIYYYRGTVYKDLDGNSIKNINRLGSIYNIITNFNSYFTRCENLSFGEFIERYSEVMRHSDSVYPSFLNHRDYFRIVSAIKDCIGTEPIKLTRLENSYIASYILGQLLEKEISENTSLDIAASLNYDNSELGFVYREGMCKVYKDFKTLKENYNCVKEKRLSIRSSEKLKLFLLVGMVTQHLVLTGKVHKLVLLDIVPFDIYFGPQWGKTVPKIIEAGTTMPTIESDSFKFVATDFVTVKMGNKAHCIKIIDAFGYTPEEIECTVEIGTSLEDVNFKITDKDRGNSRSYSIESLYMLHNEEWKEPEWT